jgi:hypothetical protein
MRIFERLGPSVARGAEVDDSARIVEFLLANVVRIIFFSWFFFLPSFCLLFAFLAARPCW